LKKKLIISVCSVFFVVGIIVLLAYTFFSLGEVKIDFRTSATIEENATEEDIIKASGIELGGTVFFRNKQKYIDNIEYEYPYLNVINIETEFPSTMVIHIAYRQEVYAVEGQDGFYICDEEFKVLKIKETFESTTENAILLSGDLQIKNEKVGDYLDIDVKLYQAFYQNNYRLGMCKDLIKEIKVEKEFDDSIAQERKVLKLNLYSGQTVSIANYQVNLPYKVYLFSQVYSSLFEMAGKESLQKDGTYERLTLENLKNCEIYINNYYTEDGILNLENEKCYFKIFIAQGVWHFWAFLLKLF